MQGKDVIRRLIQLAVLMILQVVVLNHIHLGMYAIPMVMVLFVAWAPLNTPSIRLMIASFFSGLILDTFSGTTGMSAAALTCAAFVQHPLLSALVPKETMETAEPSYSTMGTVRYLTYLFTLFLIHHIVFFALEDFSFADFPGVSMSCLTSLVVSYPLGLLLDYVRRKRL